MCSKKWRERSIPDSQLNFRDKNYFHLLLVEIQAGEQVRYTAETTTT